MIFGPPIISVDAEETLRICMYLDLCGLQAETVAEVVLSFCPRPSLVVLVPNNGCPHREIE